MTTYIPAELRRLVVDRAQNCCEYCLLPQIASYFRFQVDHIVPEKHRGETVLHNLCLSCADCNRFKGSDIGSIDLETQAFAFLFNPRIMDWNEHFHLEEVHIQPLTPEGRITEFLLRLNNMERLLNRENLIRAEKYPCDPS